MNANESLPSGKTEPLLSGTTSAERKALQGSSPLYRHHSHQAQCKESQSPRLRHRRHRIRRSSSHIKRREIISLGCRRPRPCRAAQFVVIPRAGITKAIEPSRRIRRVRLLGHKPIRRARIQRRAATAAVEVHHRSRGVIGVASVLRQRSQNGARSPAGIRLDVHRQRRQSLNRSRRRNQRQRQVRTRYRRRLARRKRESIHLRSSRRCRIPDVPPCVPHVGLRWSEVRKHSIRPHLSCRPDQHQTRRHTRQHTENPYTHRKLPVPF